MADQDFNISIRTLADLTGIKLTSQQIEALRQQQQIVNQEAKQIGASAQDVGRLLGYGLSAAIYGILRNIDQVAAGFEKLAREASKQGEILVQHAQRYAEAARGAQSEADVLKIVESALKDVRSAQENLTEESANILTPWQKITDSVYHLGLTIAQNTKLTEEAGRINQQLADAQLAHAARMKSIADQNAREAIRAGETARASFDALMSMPVEAALSKVDAQLIALHAQQNALNKGAEDYVQQWAKIQRQIEAAAKSRETLKSKEAAGFDDLSNAQNAASAGVQAVLRNEQAAQQARKEGRDKDADMFQKSADQYEKSLLPNQQQELQNIRDKQKALQPVGGIPEGPEGDIARNKKAYEDYWNQPGMADATGAAREELSKRGSERIKDLGNIEWPVAWGEASSGEVPKAQPSVLPGPNGDTATTNNILQQILDLFR